MDFPQNIFQKVLQLHNQHGIFNRHDFWRVGEVA